MRAELKYTVAPFAQVVCVVACFLFPCFADAVSLINVDQDWFRALGTMHYGISQVPAATASSARLQAWIAMAVDLTSGPEVGLLNLHFFYICRHHPTLKFKPHATDERYVLGIDGVPLRECAVREGAVAQGRRSCEGSRRVSWRAPVMYEEEGERQEGGTCSGRKMGELIGKSRWAGRNGA